MSEYLLHRIYLVLTVIAAIIFTMRLTEGGLDQDTVSSLIKIQPVVELIIIIGFLTCIFPLWIDKLKITPLRDVLHFATTVLVLFVVIVLFPEFMELSWGNQRGIVFLICMIVLAIYTVVAYIWGKKHKKNDEVEE